MCFGAIGIGFLADIFGLYIAFHLVALLGIASGIFVLAAMKEAVGRDETAANSNDD